MFVCHLDDEESQDAVVRDLRFQKPWGSQHPVNDPWEHMQQAGVARFRNPISFTCASGRDGCEELLDESGSHTWTPLRCLDVAVDPVRPTISEGSAMHGFCFT